ncbi:MAG: ParA family protein [Candidatus Promineifilaceae bacterium]
MASAKTTRQSERIFAVINRKGGVAKTTTAVHLAHGLSRKLLQSVDESSLTENEKTNHLKIGNSYYSVTGHVLLIDLDPQGSCAQALGLTPDGADIGEFLVGRQSIRDALLSTDRTDDGYPRPNLWLLPSSDNLAAAKIELINRSFSQAMMNGAMNEGLTNLLNERLGPISDRFRYIIIDCPPTLDALSRAVYQFANAAIVPVKPDYLSTSGAGRHVSDVRRAQTAGIDIKIHTILPTFYVQQQRLDRDMLALLEGWYGKRTLADPVPRSQKVAEAPASNGLTLFEFDTRRESPATTAYQSLVERVYDG